MDAEVLIVGAGPTGLALALSLAKLGVRPRIIDKAPTPGATSRALAVQARTLEFYDALGFARGVVDDGYEFASVNIRARGRRSGRVRIGDAGAGISPYPFVLVYPQDEHERFLIARLEELGVRVEREAELVGLTQDEGGVVATVRRADGSTETITSAYACGCDGAHSAVRKLLNFGFPGGKYDQAFFVADVIGSGESVDGELHACLGDSTFALVFPMKGDGRVRLLGTIPRDVDHKVEDHSLTFDDVRAHASALAAVDVSEVRWFSSYRIHHRVADRFRSGRAFLLGDAAHIHSPVGGQGMNTGIGDAVNLAWKLADVLRGRAGAALLDSYEPERIAFARRLVATTDRAFFRVVDPSPLGRFFRLRVVPALFPMLTRLRSVRRAMFRLVSQTGIEYRSGPISRGSAGPVHGGDRLPWVRFIGEASNYDPLRDRRWQVHVYGRATDPLRSLCDARDLPLHVFTWSDSYRDAGLRRDAFYLVRPDGYVAFASASQGLPPLADYLDRLRGG